MTFFSHLTKQEKYYTIVSVCEDMNACLFVLCLC